MSIGKHLATLNLFREADNSIHVTIAEARGVREELGDSGAPVHLCAMSALRAAVEMREIPADVSRLVIAAREVVFGGLFDAARFSDPDARRTLKELDAASEAFADRVPWDDEPASADTNSKSRDAKQGSVAEGDGGAVPAKQGDAQTPSDGDSQ